MIIIAIITIVIIIMFIIKAITKAIIKAIITITIIAIIAIVVIIIIIIKIIVINFDADGERNFNLQFSIDQVINLVEDFVVIEILLVYLSFQALDLMKSNTFFM